MLKGIRIEEGEDRGDAGVKIVVVLEGKPEMSHDYQTRTGKQMPCNTMTCRVPCWNWRGGFHEGIYGPTRPL